MHHVFFATTNCAFNKVLQRFKLDLVRRFCTEKERVLKEEAYKPDGENTEANDSKEDERIVVPLAHIATKSNAATKIKVSSKTKTITVTSQQFVCNNRKGGQRYNEMLQQWYVKMSYTKGGKEVNDPHRPFESVMTRELGKMQLAEKDGTKRCTICMKQLVLTTLALGDLNLVLRATTCSWPEV